MTKDEARAVVFATIRSVSDRLDDYETAEAAANLNLSELGLDSMAMIEISMEVEERTGVVIDLSEIRHGTTLDGFCELLVAKAAPGAAPSP